jgi:glutamine synthetase
VCCPRGGPHGTNAEYKAFDGTANPYIGLAALVAAGILGESWAHAHALQAGCHSC